MKNSTFLAAGRKTKQLLKERRQQGIFNQGQIKEGLDTQEEPSTPEEKSMQERINSRLTTVRNWITDNIIARKVKAFGGFVTGVAKKIGSIVPSPKADEPTSETSAVSAPTPDQETAEQSSDEPADIRKADKLAAAALDKQCQEMQEGVIPAMSRYRQQSNVENANTEGFQIMRKPELSPDPDLQEAAEIIAKELATTSRTADHLDEWNPKWREDPRFAKIKDLKLGEMAQRGGRSAAHVVQKFRDSKEEKDSNRHHQFLTGDYDRAACAVVPYTDPDSGETMFVTVVLTTARNEQLSGEPQSVEPQKSEIRLDHPELVDLNEQTTLEQMIGKRSALKAHFDALEVRRRLKHRDMQVEFDLESTKKLPLDQRELGSFDVRVGGIIYTVSDHPPVFNYWLSDQKKFVSVPFSQVFEHAQKTKTQPPMKEAPAAEKMTEQELADENVPTAEELAQIPVQGQESKKPDQVSESKA